MDKSSFLILALIIIATLGVFNISHETENQDAELLYQYKVEFNNFKFNFNKKYEV